MVEKDPLGPLGLYLPQGCLANKYCHYSILYVCVCVCDNQHGLLAHLSRVLHLIGAAWCLAEQIYGSNPPILTQPGDWSCRPH